MRKLKHIVVTPEDHRLLEQESFYSKVTIKEIIGEMVFNRYKDGKRLANLKQKYETQKA